MITKEQAIQADIFHYCNPNYKDGKCQNWRRAGQTQTWKTRPNNFRVPVKFGLYDHGQITQDLPMAYWHTADTCDA